MSDAPEDLRDLEQMHQDWLNAPTLSAAMQLPEVRALVEVARMASEHYLDIAFHREGDVLRAALAPFDDDLNAAKALQTELARVICDAVNSMFNTDCAE